MSWVTRYIRYDDGCSLVPVITISTGRKHGIPTGTGCGVLCWKVLGWSGRNMWKVIPESLVQVVLSSCLSKAAIGSAQPGTGCLGVCLCHPLHHMSHQAASRLSFPLDLLQCPDSQPLLIQLALQHFQQQLLAHDAAVWYGHKVLAVSLHINGQQGLSGEVAQLRV